MRKEGTDLKYHHFDELGSTLFLTDANGVQTDKYVYNAWGKVVSSSGTTVNPFKYVGRLGYYTHAEAGNTLLLLGTRFYDPDAGVFTQRDAAKDGLSWYSYTSGQSMVAVDPWGMSPHTDRVQFWLPWLYRLADNCGNASGMYDASTATGWEVVGQASLFSFGLGVSGFAWEKAAADFIPRASAGVSYAAGHVYEEPVMRRTLGYAAGRVARWFCGIANTVTPIYSDFDAIWKVLNDCVRNGKFNFEPTVDGWLNSSDESCIKSLAPFGDAVWRSLVQIGIGTVSLRVHL